MRMKDACTVLQCMSIAINIHFHFRIHISYFIFASIFLVPPSRPFLQPRHSHSHSIYSHSHLFATFYIRSLSFILILSFPSCHRALTFRMPAPRRSKRYHVLDFSPNSIPLTTFLILFLFLILIHPLEQEISTYLETFIWIWSSFSFSLVENILNCFAININIIITYV